MWFLNAVNSSTSLLSIVLLFVANGPLWLSKKTAHVLVRGPLLATWWKLPVVSSDKSKHQKTKWFRKFIYCHLDVGFITTVHDIMKIQKPHVSSTGYLHTHTIQSTHSTTAYDWHEAERTGLLFLPVSAFAVAIIFLTLASIVREIPLQLYF